MRIERFIAVTAVFAIAVSVIFSAAAGTESSAADRKTFSAETYLAPGEDRARVLVLYRSEPVRERSSAALERGGRVKITRSFTLIPADQLEISRADLPAAISALRDDPEVIAVEPDRKTLRASAQLLPWGVNRINAEQVHALGNVGGGVKVAVLDTGVNYNHLDLMGNYAGGTDIVNGDGDPMDDSVGGMSGHGTHVAGTIAAVDNSRGVIGVSPAVDIYAVKVLDQFGLGFIGDFITGLQWAVNSGAKVVNLSAGSPAGSAALEAACQAAYNDGVIIVAAAGNAFGEPVEFPAAYDTVLAVGATNENNSLAGFSNHGPALDLVAPGVSIYSTALVGGYQDMDGTSMAAPHVAGTAALVVKSGLTSPANVMDRLKSTARDLGPSGRDNRYGFGLVDAADAILATDFITSPAGGEIVPAGSFYTVTWDPPPNAVSYRLSFSTDNGKRWRFMEGGSHLTGSSYLWQLPLPRENKKKARLRIAAFNGSGDKIGRDLTEKFVIKVIQVDTPARGEVLTSGNPYLLTWTVHATKRPVNLVILAFSRNGGKSWTRIGTVPGDQPSESPWTVPVVQNIRAQSKFRVTLKDVNGIRIGRAEKTFTLHP